MVESSEAILKAANSLMKRLPPKQVGKNLTGVVKLVEDENIQQDLLDKIHQPLKRIWDDEINREFIQHEYNRDGDYCRSPWSNKFFVMELQDKSKTPVMH
jgi:hypothetical protein